MELGLDLDDDSLFEIPKDPKERHLPPICLSKCSLKICSPQWYYDDNCINVSPKDYTYLKYRADHEYITQQYDTALTHYQESQAMLQHVGSATWRDIEEGKIRCLINLGRLLESLELARKLAQMAQNVDHVTAGLHLLLDIQRKLDNSLAESQLIRKLVSLHPQVPRLWMRLGELCASSEDVSSIVVQVARTDAVLETDVLETATESHRTNGVAEKLDRLEVTADVTSRDPPTRHDVVAAAANVRALTCYMMARSLLRKVRKTVSSFAKEQNEKLIIEVQDRLEKLAMPHSVSESCRKFVQRTLSSLDNETTIDADNVASSTDDIVASGHHNFSQITDEYSDIGDEFDSRWFSWCQSSLTSNDQ